MKCVKRMWGLCCAFFIFASCASKPDVYKDTDIAVQNGKLEHALDIINTKRKSIYKANNNISFLLDKGFLKHYIGDFGGSYTDLTAAEGAIADAYTKSVTQNIASYIANDNTKDYAGEDYEDIFVNIINSLNAYHERNGQALALINDLTAAGGELLVLQEKYKNDEKKAKGFIDGAIAGAAVLFSLGELEWPKPQKVLFNNSALARYLGAVFSLEAGNIDFARYQMFELQNAFKSKFYEEGRLSIPKPLIVTGKRGYETGPLLDIPQGKGQLNVLAFSGLSPVKIEKTVRIPFPSFYFPKLVAPELKVPSLVKRISVIKNVTVTVNDTESVQMDLLEDISNIVIDTFNARYSSILSKTFARVLVKLAIADVSAHITRKAMVENGMPEFLAWTTGAAAINTAQAALNATESADVRMGRYLPEKAYLGILNLDPGIHKVTVEYENGDTFKKQVEIRDGHISLVETSCLK